MCIYEFVVNFKFNIAYLKFLEIDPTFMFSNKQFNNISK